MAVYRDRLREFIVDWLSTLTREGWSGTAAELGDEWYFRAEFMAVIEAKDRDAEIRRRCPNAKPSIPRVLYLPVGSGISKALVQYESAIHEAGWRAVFTRSAVRRTITFKRCRKPRSNQLTRRA